MTIHQATLVMHPFLEEVKLALISTHVISSQTVQKG